MTTATDEPLEPTPGPGTLPVTGLLLAMVALSAGGWSDVAAQEWSAELRGGELRYEGGPGLEKTTAAVGLRYRSPTTGVSLSGGIPLSAEDALWGAAAGAHRFAREVGPLSLGVDLSGDLFVQHDRTRQTLDDGILNGGPVGRRRPLPEAPLDGWGASAGVMPLVGVGGPALGLELRAGGTAYRSEFADESFERDLLELDATASWAPSPRVLLNATARRATADGADHDRVGGSVTLDHGQGILWASAGRWIDDEIGDAEWAAGATLDVTSSVALRATARHVVFDPLYLTPERTTWGVGVSVTLAGPSAPAPPIPAAYEGGRATIALEGGEVPGESDGPVRIAGDFTDWEPEAMERTGDGWRYTRPLEPGVYNYAFVTSDGRWFVPEGQPGRKADGFGGHVAVLVVEEAS